MQNLKKKLKRSHSFHSEFQRVLLQKNKKISQVVCHTKKSELRFRHNGYVEFQDTGLFKNGKKVQ